MNSFLELQIIDDLVVESVKKTNATTWWWIDIAKVTTFLRPVSNSLGEDVNLMSAAPLSPYVIFMDKLW